MSCGSFLAPNKKKLPSVSILTLLKRIAGVRCASNNSMEQDANSSIPSVGDVIKNIRRGTVAKVTGIRHPQKSKYTAIYELSVGGWVTDFGLKDYVVLVGNRKPICEDTDAMRAKFGLEGVSRCAKSAPRYDIAPKVAGMRTQKSIG